MVPFHLQIELSGRPAALMAEQLDQLADSDGFIRYQIRTFNHNTVVHVNVEDEAINPEKTIGFNEEAVFSQEEMTCISLAIREFNHSHRLNFDQMNFDF